MIQKFEALPSTTKMAVYAGSGAAGALLLSALVFACVRQRRAGRRERDAYNAKIEKEREDAYKEQVELREKGLGGWDSSSTLGEDALGGWGGSHVPQGYEKEPEPPVPTIPSNMMGNEVPSRMASPAGYKNSGAGMDRSWTPPVLSPVPQSPAQMGLIQNAGNAYSGGYGGNRNIPSSPQFPSQPHQQPPPGGFPGVYSQRRFSRNQYQQF